MVIRKDFIIQVFLFLLVGTTTFLIDLVFTIFLSSFLHFPPYLASSLGFLSGFFFNFPMNRKKVFRHSEDDRFNIRTQIIFYIILALFNLAVTSILSELIVGWGINIGYAKVIITILIATWNFIIFRYFVFSKNN